MHIQFYPTKIGIFTGKTMYWKLNCKTQTFYSKCRNYFHFTRTYQITNTHIQTHRTWISSIGSTSMGWKCFNVWRNPDLSCKSFWHILHYTLSGNNSSILRHVISLLVNVKQTNERSSNSVLMNCVECFIHTQWQRIRRWQRWRSMNACFRCVVNIHSFGLS